MEMKVMCLSGRITADNAAELKHQFNVIIGDAACILDIDLEGVSYVDSAGLSALVYAFKLNRKLGGAVRVFRPQKRVKDLLAITHMDQVLTISDQAPPVLQTA